MVWDGKIFLAMLPRCCVCASFCIYTCLSMKIDDLESDMNDIDPDRTRQFIGGNWLDVTGSFEILCLTFAWPEI